MRTKVKMLLTLVRQMCEEEGRSLEYTIEKLMKETGLEFEAVITYLNKYDKSYEYYKKAVNDILSLANKLGLEDHNENVFVIRAMPMDRYPVRAKDLKGNDEQFSVTVNVYDHELGLYALGWYNFDTKKWSIHGDESVKMKCWCYIPDMSLFVRKYNWRLPAIKNDGYQEK